MSSERRTNGSLKSTMQLMGQEQALTRTSASHMHLCWKIMIMTSRKWSAASPWCWPKLSWRERHSQNNWCASSRHSKLCMIRSSRITSNLWKTNGGWREYWVDWSDWLGKWEVQVTTWGRNLEEQRLKQVINHCTYCDDQKGSEVQLCHEDSSS